VTEGPEVVLPSRDDPVVRAGSEGIGGPAGSRVLSGAGWWTPLRVMLAMVFVVAGLGVVAKEHCRAEGWTVPGQYVHACYSDIPLLYQARGLEAGVTPYLDTDPRFEPVEYPVLTGAVMWLTAKLVPGGGDASERALRYFDINVVLIALCTAVVVVATIRVAGRRPWDAAMVALAPGILLAGTINWDMYAVALTSLAMWAWARERPAAAGVLLGLATAAKFYPLLLLGPLFLLCFRAGQLRAFWRTTGAAVLAWLAVNLPVMLANFDGWARFYTLSRERGAGFSSFWFTLFQHGWRIGPSSLNTLAGLLFVACCLAIAWLAVAAPRRPRLPQLAFLVVAAFLLTNKVYSPQYVVWLIPLAVLARPRWRDFLIWQACEVVHFIGIWEYLVGSANPSRALPQSAYDVTVLLHIAGTLWFAAMVVRDVWWPEHDPVRADGVTDDPAGGVLDGAPDVFEPSRLRPHHTHPDSSSGADPALPVGFPDH
jgi:uncharacterized membrane protein